MIKDNQKSFNRLQIAMDALLIIAAYVSAYYLRFRVLYNYKWMKLMPGEGHLRIEVYMSYLLYIVPGYLFLYYICNLYKPKRGKRKIIDVWNLFQANALGALYFSFILYFIKEVNMSRWAIILFVFLNYLYGTVFRYCLAKILRVIRKKGKNQKHVLIVGYSRAAEAYVDRIVENPDWGYHTIGILDDYMQVGTAYKHIKVIGDMGELEKLLIKNNLDEIVITLSIKEYDRLEKIVHICEKTGVHTKFVPDYNNIIASNPYMEDLYGLPVINIRNVPLSNTLSKLIKRIFDLIGAVFALIVFGIPMIMVALIIKITSPGPIIFSQTRVGLHNKNFKMYKFRSMRVQNEKAEEKAWTTKGDPRVTRIGRFIRKTSIDELPQLFNVLIGNMSLVGPRPERPFYVEKFKEEVPRYMIKHQVRPGLTGWAQIKGYRGDTSITKRIQYDLYYIENWTFGLDIKIMFLTIFKGFVNKNAY